MDTFCARCSVWNDNVVNSGRSWSSKVWSIRIMSLLTTLVRLATSLQIILPLTSLIPSRTSGPEKVSGTTRSPFIVAHRLKTCKSFWLLIVVLACVQSFCACTTMPLVSVGGQTQGLSALRSILVSNFQRLPYLPQAPNHKAPRRRKDQKCLIGRLSTCHYSRAVPFVTRMKAILTLKP